VKEAIRQALEPFSRTGSAEGPYQVQYALQEAMQELAGIVRREEELEQASGAIEELKERAKRVAVTGNREYNPSWHTALDLEHLLTVAEAVVIAARARK